MLPEVPLNSEFMTEGFQYEVFLSHNQADKPRRVRRLAERRRAAGPFKFGTRNSEFGIPRLCLSLAALGSDWVGLERSAVGRGNLPFRDPGNARRRFIPLHPSEPHRLSPEKSH